MLHNFFGHKNWIKIGWSTMSLNISFFETRVLVVCFLPERVQDCENNTQFNLLTDIYPTQHWTPSFTKFLLLFSEKQITGTDQLLVFKLAGSLKINPTYPAKPLACFISHRLEIEGSEQRAFLLTIFPWCWNEEEESGGGGKMSFT